MYAFVSFSNLKGRNLGACIVRIDTLETVHQEIQHLGLFLNCAHEARAYPLSDADFPQQEMELNKLYSREELIAKGFERDTQ